MQAMRYAWKCMCMGPPWVLWDEMTESLKFLYVTMGLTEVYKTSWITHTSWITEARLGNKSTTQTFIRSGARFNHFSRSGCGGCCFDGRLAWVGDCWYALDACSWRRSCTEGSGRREGA